MLEINEIRELIQLMTENDIAEVSIKKGDAEIALKRMGAQTVVHGVPAPPALVSPTTSAGSAAPQTPTEAEGLLQIASPMVGTFYASPDPNSPPYVTIGSEVSEETVVCIVEAMKVFNEIKADMRGTIAKIVAANEEGVDFGQPLFLVRPH
ncbi:MAG: acetyl-CoA carboxylase biotin carboxyl carrier protein [Phycisphaerales bacterium]|nr:MAG: acetyl-CoA carboxylase biotin carboxyl carrier protein [Phycisphaerales bacterium]